MHKIAILTYDGLALFELGCAVEVFALSRPELSDWYHTQIVTFENHSLAATGEVQLHAKEVQDLSEFDTLIIPSWHTRSNKIKLQLAEQLVEFCQRGKRLVSFCSGSFLLAQLGLLNGKKPPHIGVMQPCFSSAFLMWST